MFGCLWVGYCSLLCCSVLYKMLGVYVVCLGCLLLVLGDFLGFLLFVCWVNCDYLFDWDLVCFDLDLLCCWLVFIFACGLVAVSVMICGFVELGVMLFEFVGFG